MASPIISFRGSSFSENSFVEKCAQNLYQIAQHIHQIVIKVLKTLFPCFFSLDAENLSEARVTELPPTFPIGIQSQKFIQAAQRAVTQSEKTKQVCEEEIQKHKIRIQEVEKEMQIPKKRLQECIELLKTCPRSQGYEEAIQNCKNAIHDFQELIKEMEEEKRGYEEEILRYEKVLQDSEMVGQKGKRQIQELSNLPDFY